MKELITQTKEIFQLYFIANPDHIFLSPGRINVIGEHIDYNDGLVLPAAIDKYICFAVRKRPESSLCRIIALDFNESFSFDTDTEINGHWPAWAGYLLGVADEIKKLGKKIGGLDIVFKGNIPIGAGLSSSAALECGFGLVLNTLFKLNLSKQDIALISQKAENNFVGVNCGIMDQFSSLFGQKDKVIMLNCNTLEYHYYDAKMTDHSFVLFDSGVKHTHLSSGYNDRRREVEAGKKIIKKQFPKMKSFRECTYEMLEACKSELGEILYKRCLYVIEEIDRVGKAAGALRDQDLNYLGNLLNQTHFGLSQQYEVSCPEIDFLVEQALEMDGVLGARMMGGGFGGCSINLIKNEKETDIIEEMKLKYQEAYGITLKVYHINISDGTKEYKEND